MSDTDGGFSFGASPEPIPSDFDDVDAIDVSGEPVSRSEAKKMGISSFQRDNKTSVKMRMDSLPKDTSSEVTRKLEAAWQHLKRNEIEDALTLAQEVVWEQPTLVTPKLIIARCFINRKEYEKALSLLQAISEHDGNAETLYYTGLCQSRLGRIKDAIDTLKQARKASTDALIRKRSAELLKHLQGEQIDCPICGKKALYDSMVDVGDQTICANCAKKRKHLEEEEDDDYDDESLDDGTGRRRKKLKPPLSKADIMVRALFALFVVGVLWGGFYAMSLAFPATYASMRGYIPDWTGLPRALTPQELRPQAPVELGTVSSPRLVPNLQFDSPPISQAIAGVQFRHKAFIADMGRREGIYGVNIYPAPKGEYDIVSKTGEFTWTPSQEDAGKTFEVSFTAVFGTMRARDQINEVTVSSGPRFTSAVRWLIPKVGDARHFLATDLNGDGVLEYVLAGGSFWEGNLAAFAKNLDGRYEQMAAARLPGRPSGLGVILADEEPWLAVADYWSSRLRFYALRGGNLSEMAVDIDLPGRPILAGFDMRSSTSAILCRMEDGNRVLAYRQRGQLRFEKIGEWTVPDEFVWRKILLTRGNFVDNVETRLVLVGGEAANSIHVMDIGSNTPRQVRLGVEGTLVDADVGPDGNVYCLVENGGNLTLTGFSLNGEGPPAVLTPVSAGAGPALCGFAAANLSGRFSAADLLILSSNRIGIAFPVSATEIGQVNHWDLPKPARLFGPAVVASSESGDGPEVIYLDTEGALWTVDLQRRDAADNENED